MELSTERARATFNTEALSEFLYGGREALLRKRQISETVESDPVFTGVETRFLSRPDYYAYGVQKGVHWIDKKHSLDLNKERDSYLGVNSVYSSEGATLGLHVSMFIPTITGQGTDEQQAFWLNKAKNYHILGTYAQTELGHGTFVRGLETTSTYDPATEEFVLDSPTLTATKWWPGGLGKTSNYAVVMARLITQGKECGIQPFMVQLRDLETHEPLPGIETGDIGPKLGYETVDNGFLRFNKVRIPRMNMLMRISQVAKDGTFSRLRNEKLTYGTMVYVRATFVWRIAARSLAKACTVALRYSCIRKGADALPNKGETAIINYQTQLYKLLPNLAKSFALWIAGNYIMDAYFRITENIRQGDVGELPELHGTSAGLKAYSTDMASNGIELCRMACGGHGYSQSSALPKIFVNSVLGNTVEGENTVMYLQTARYLIKTLKEAKEKNVQLKASVAYLGQPPSTTSSLVDKVTLVGLNEALKHRAYRLLTEASARLDLLATQGHKGHEAWNKSKVLLVKVARAHCEYFVLEKFAETLISVENKEIQAVLEQLCLLYGVNVILQEAGDFLQDGFLSSKVLDNIKNAEEQLLVDLRPNAVALTDAFDFSDHYLSSLLGRHDGQVYQHILEWSRSNPLNKIKPAEISAKLKPLLGSRL